MCIKDYYPYYGHTILREIMQKLPLEISTRMTFPKLSIYKEINLNVIVAQ
jgi:hypothetical protein